MLLNDCCDVWGAIDSAILAYGSTKIPGLKYTRNAALVKPIKFDLPLNMSVGKVRNQFCQWFQPPLNDDKIL